MSTDAIPRAVLSEQLEKRIDHRRVLAAVFLTFEFDPGFFEQQVLPVLLDVPLSHATGIRLVQLEDALRACAGHVAVYYDADRLVCSDAGSGHLDVQRVPVRHRTGAFHPKNVLLLLEDPLADDEGRKPRSLLVGAMSANLTRSGWWENIECAHFEEVKEGEMTRLKDDVRGLLHRLKRQTADGLEHPAADELLGFLKSVDQRTHRVSGDAFHAHFYSGVDSFPEFLEQCAGEWLRGSSLEILSPYTDDSAACRPLEELMERFDIREARVLLPRDRGGAAACSQRLYEGVRRMENVSWGRLPAAFMRTRATGAGNERFVHAKLYRFFRKRPKMELCFAGSVNLTTAAHQSGGNWETGLLVEVPCAVTPDFWLVREDERPPQFAHSNETTSEAAMGTPLSLRYHWDRRRAEVHWDAKDSSPRLTLTARGQDVGSLEPMEPELWHALGDEWSVRLETLLKESSFVLVHGHASRPGLLLVQEEGMSHKPSRLFQLTVPEILRYWAMLTPAQRAAFVEVKAPELAISELGAEWVARVMPPETIETLFDRFAGCFHAFNCLRDEVRLQLAEGRHAQANYRLFGRKYDSLGTLLDLAAKESSPTDDVNRYVVFMCARQLCRELSREFSDYWKTQQEGARALEDRLAQCAEIRNRLAGKDTEMPAFLDWFDEWFLSRATRMEDER